MRRALWRGGAGGRQGRAEGRPAGPAAPGAAVGAAAGRPLKPSGGRFALRAVDLRCGRSVRGAGCPLGKRERSGFLRCGRGVRGAGPEGESLRPAGGCRGAGTGPQARRRPAPPPRAEPVGFGEAETACGPLRPLRKLLQKGFHPAMIKGRTINAYERGRIPCPKRKGF